jgi:hypothetical protein
MKYLRYGRSSAGEFASIYRHSLHYSTAFISSIIFNSYLI